MATVLKNNISFSIPTIGGAPTVLPHGLNISGTPVTPQIFEGDRPGFAIISVDATDISVIRLAHAPGAGLNVYVEFDYTIYGEASVPQSFPQYGGNATGANGLPLMTVSNLLTSATNPNLVPAGQIVRCDPTAAPVTVTLPLAGPSGGMSVYVKDQTGNANVNNITVAASGGQLIDGAATALINTSRGGMILVSNGTGWMIAART